MLSKILFLLFIITISLNSYAQKLILLKGIVVNDSIDVEGITIINKNLAKSTKTNHLGFFELPVDLKDSIVVTAIHLKRKSLLITQDVLDKGELEIKVNAEINEMDELVLNQKLSPAALDFSAAYMMSTKVDEESRRRMEVTRLANTDPTRIFGGGGAAGGTGAFNITDPLFMLIGKLAKQLKKKGLSKKEKKKRVKLFKQGFMNEYGDSYFTEELKISRLEIDDFIKFCNKKESLYFMYSKGEKLELIDFLMKQSVYYREQKLK